MLYLSNAPLILQTINFEIKYGKKSTNSINKLQVE